MIQVPSGQQIKPLISPRGGPGNGDVTFTVIEAVPLMPLRIGFGSFKGYEWIAREQADTNGYFSKVLKVPYWAERDRIHFFFLSLGGGRPHALSDPFHVTAPDGTARVIGTLGADAGSCLALDGPDQTRYSLQGPIRGWAPGTRVLIIGTVASEPACEGGGLPISVREIHAA